MADHKKRILIVDDSLGIHLNIDNLFKNCGVEVEVGYAYDAEEAMDILRSWIAAGHRPNIITADDNYFGHGADGHVVLDSLLSHLEEHAPDLMPEKFFIQSKGGGKLYDLKWGTPDPLDTLELTSIASWGEDEFYETYFVHEAMYYSTTLRKYCNDHWGTNFALSSNSCKFRIDPDAKFTPDSIYDLIEAGETGIKDGLPRIDPADDFFVAHVHLNDDDLTPKASFLDGAGGPVSGRLAFDGEDIAMLKRQYPGQSVILCADDYDPSIAALFADIDGIILIGEGREHLKIVTENAGIAAVLGLDKEANFMKVKNLTLHGKKISYNLDKYDEALNDYSSEPREVGVGEEITLSCRTYTLHHWDGTVRDGCEGILHMGRLETWTIDNQYKDSWIQEFSSLCDSVRAKGFRIDANADSARQVAVAVDLDTDGIGLVRTEHMFFEADRQAGLQETLLTPDDAMLVTLKSLHKGDLCALYNAAVRNEQPVGATIRLLDASPREFLDDDQVIILENRVGRENMRGVALAHKTPGLYRMQIEAIFEAAADAGYGAPVDILIPLVRDVSDVTEIRRIAEQTAAGKPYRLGAMIETLAAVAAIKDIALACDFLKIGTNDLMSEIMNGVARHDMRAINTWMIENGVRGLSPFRQIVPQLEKVITDIVAQARAVCPEIDITACGQQMGEDYRATDIAVRLGLNGVSVSSKYLTQARVNAAYYTLQHQNPAP